MLIINFFNLLLNPLDRLSRRSTNNMKIIEKGIGLSKFIARNDVGPKILNDLALKWKQIEKQHSISILPMFYAEEEDADEHIVHSKIFPFLESTGLIISGGDLQILFSLKVDNIFYQFSWREWGGYMAEWMNKKYSHPHEWINSDFYDLHNTSSKIIDYEQYLKNLQRLINLKSNQ